MLGFSHDKAESTTKTEGASSRGPLRLGDMLPRPGMLAALCVAYALLRVWYTIVVNMSGLVDGSPESLQALGSASSVGATARVVADLLIALFAGRIKTLAGRGWIATLAACLLALSAIQLFGLGWLWPAGTAMVVSAGIFFAVGSDILYLSWSEAMVRYDDRALGWFILCKNGLDALLSLLVFLPRDLLLALCIALPALSAAGLIAAQKAETGHGARRQHRWHTIDARLLPALAVGIAALFFGFSFSQSPVMGSGEGASDTTMLAIIGRWLTFSLIVVGLRLARDFRFEFLYQIAAVTAIVGFVLRMLDVTGSYEVYLVASIAAARVAEDATVMALVSVSRYTVASPLRVLAWGRVCFRAGGWIARTAANAALGLFVSLPASLAQGLVCTVEIVLLAVTGMWLLRGQSINAFLWGRGASEAARGQTRQRGKSPGQTRVDGEEAAVREPEPCLVISPTCRYLANEHGLTQRETDVLALLLDGRSVPYIQETLHVSSNTAKTHVRHIYQKFGIHNRQDLITCAQNALT